QRGRADTFDRILVPALTRAKRDASLDFVEESELAFIHCFFGDLLEDLEATPERPIPTTAVRDPSLRSGGVLPDADSLRVLSVPVSDRADALALRMLALLLEPSGCSLTILETPETPLRLADRIAELDPHLIVLSHLPPGGLTTTRYLVR